MKQLNNVLILIFIYTQISFCQLANSQWPMFQYDLQHTGRSPYTGPSKAVLKWEFQTLCTKVGSPSIAEDGTIYLPAGYLFGDTLGYLYAINPDGTEKWKYLLAGPPSSTTPAVGSDGTIYVHANPKENTAGQGKLYAINSDGTLKWIFEFGTLLAGYTISSPVIGIDGTIYIGSKNTGFYAINPDGTTKWVYTITSSSITSSPVISSDGTIYIIDPFKIAAFSPSGTSLWVKSLGNSSASSEASPCIGPDGTIYTGEKHDLYALYPDSTTKWTYQTTGTQSIWSSPAVATDGTVYLGDDGLYAINPDGSLKWKFNPASTSQTFESPVVDSAGTIYWRSSSTLYAVNPNGTQKWQLSVSSNQNSAAGAPINSNGTIYIPTGGKLKAYGTAPSASFNKKTINFGHMEIDHSSTQTVIITNTGIADLIISNIATTNSKFGFNPTDATILPDSSKIFSITFTPTTYGLQSGGIIFTHNASSSPETVAVSGTGVYLRTLIDPDGDGGFENGSTLADNGWTAVNGSQTNKWYVGTATSNGGTRGGYISNDGGTSNQYTTTSTSIVHFYRDISFPSGDSSITLKFNWKCQAENGFDYMRVFLISTSTTPIAGTVLSTGQIGATYYNLQSSYQSASISIDNSNIGTVKRLVFSWKNDFTGGTQPPPAVDNISVTTETTEFVPVELMTFTAITRSNSVILKWNTATEVSNFGFDIERRQIRDSNLKSQIENPRWFKVGFISGAGTINTQQEYSFIDTKLSAGRYEYRLKQIDNDGSFKYSTSVEVDYNLIPTVFSLAQNFPNPFNPSTSFSFDLPEKSFVSLKVFDMIGKEIASIVSEEMPAGSYQKQWNASRFASGIYFYRLQAGSYTETKKLLLLK